MNFLKVFYYKSNVLGYLISVCKCGCLFELSATRGMSISKTLHVGRNSALNSIVGLQDIGCSEERFGITCGFVDESAKYLNSYIQLKKCQICCPICRTEIQL
jgi:hypothetical protein